MFNVTDVAFREMFARYGQPDVMFTEFVSCNGLQSPGRDKLLVDFKFTQKQRPIVAQIWGEKVENYRQTAELCAELGFDGIDINMGCPDKAVLKQGACGALIDQPDLAKKIIRETMRGAGKLPVSVKTRLGVRRNEIEDWTKHILETQPAALIVHGRTCKEMSKVPARWDEIAKARQVRDQLGGKTLVLGNGDVRDLVDAKSKAAEYKLDGVMIGRGAFGNPWAFNPKRPAETLTLEEKLEALVEHTVLFDKWLSRHKSFMLMRKHFSSYISGYPNTKALKMELMETQNAKEVARIIKKFLKNSPGAKTLTPMP